MLAQRREVGIGRAIGADAYCRDAAIAVETAKRLLAARRAAAHAA